MVLEFFAAAIAVLALDQATKTLVLARLRPERAVTGTARSGPFLRLVVNGRPAFGCLRSRRALVLAWGLVAVGLLPLVWMPAFHDAGARVGLGVGLGGATGNVIDRVARDGVVDFIDLRVWPVFNLADVAIVCGVAAVAWFGL